MKLEYDRSNHIHRMWFIYCVEDGKALFFTGEKGELWSNNPEKAHLYQTKTWAEKRQKELKKGRVSVADINFDWYI